MELHSWINISLPIHDGTGSIGLHKATHTIINIFITICGRYMPVKLFRGSTTGLRDKRDFEDARKTFEDEINEFLSNPQIEVIDIKFTAVGEPDIKYPPRLYALVYYKIKGEIDK